jgi:hypothetical protein
MGHVLNWTPGNHGKGIVTPKGETHTWNVDRQDGTPNHPEYLEQALGAHDTNPYTEYNAFEIGPEGKVYEGPADIDKLDPRLVPTNKWRFQSVTQHQLGWEPGQWGKGLIHDGAVHTWGVGPNQDGSPTHPEYAERAFGINGEPGHYEHHDMFDTAFGITPEGMLNVFDDNSWSSHPENYGKVAAQAEAADPRLRTNPSQGIWSFQARVAMPVGEDYWRDWQEKGEHGLYHGTTPARLESIMQHGLHPWDSPIAGGSTYDTAHQQWLMPRPGHVYMAQNPKDAWDRALDDVNRKSNPPEEPIVLKVNPAYLAPQHLNPDEDDMLPNEKIDSFVSPQKGYDSLGQMAEAMGFGNVPSETERQITRGKHVGYRGVIPPEALQPGEMRNGAWQPIEWPRIASLIGGMRDSCGRFAVAAPWELGKSGKGLYFPDTGALQTWADDRTHPDVWGDDENYSQPGNAHHLVIRPNGTVRDQGCLDRDFEDADGDVEGLQMALKALNPSLRLDAPTTWDFGSTEPMEEEPSSVSRGEDGGTIHDVQTANDFAGSL